LAELPVRRPQLPQNPAFDDIEEQLARQPPITPPAIVLHGACDGLVHPDSSFDAGRHYLAYYDP
jgi:hypothetical protein